MNHKELLLNLYVELYDWHKMYGFEFSDGNKEDFMGLVEMIASSGESLDPKSKSMYNQFLEELNLV